MARRTVGAQEMARRLVAARTDPAVFGAAFLGGRYTPDQLRVLREVRDHERVVVHSGHGVGKTRVAADVVLWWLHSRRPAIAVTTAPTWNQVDEILWSEIRRRHSGATVDLGSPSPAREPALRIDNYNYALGMSPDKPENIQGFHSANVLVVIDEAGGVKRSIWEALEGAVSGENVRFLAIGNPTEPAGPFYEACLSKLWRTIRINCYDHPNVIEGKNLFPGMVTRRWVEDAERNWGTGSPIYQARVLGIFPEQSEDTLISLSDVQRCTEADIPALPTDPVIISCDVARFGSNETVVMVLHGRRVIELRTWVGQDTMKTSGELIRTKTRISGEAIFVVDDDGIGGAVTDRLRELGHYVRTFRGGAKPRDEDKFINLRSEAWWSLRDEMRGGRLRIPEDDTLKSQLVTPRYSFRKVDKIEVETKDSMAKRDVASPDRADALVMALWGLGRGMEESVTTESKPKRGGTGDDWREQFTDAAPRRAITDWRDDFDRILG